MTLAATNADWADAKESVAAKPQSGVLSVWPVAAFTALAAFIVFITNWADPMIRHDDFPAMLAYPEGFWLKTLNEGRWLNYIWHLREIVTPSWLNYAAYQLLWVIFCAAVAVATMRDDRPDKLPIAIAVLLMLAPPATLISLWFNTLLPGLALVALYAVMGCRMSVRAHRAFLPLFVVATFMAYTTYPILLLVVCLVQTRNRSWGDLAGLVVLFGASFVAAVLLTYSINWYVHGVFDVPLASWREATPAEDMAGMLANAAAIKPLMLDFLITMTYHFQPGVYFHIGMLIAATLVLARYAPMKAVYLHTGLAIGLALLAAQVVKLGVKIPPRAFLFVWVFYVAILGSALTYAMRWDGWGPRVAFKLVLFLVLSYMFQTFKQTNTYGDWQSDTRAMAEAVGEGRAPVIVVGNLCDLPSCKGASIQTIDALKYRLWMIGGRKDVYFCNVDPESCVDAAPTATRLIVSGTGWRVEHPT